ncbi:MAG: enoyl-CoA hydratase [Rhodobacterales bacterium]|nr:MAG: enoyl-CoA hydratase [Rhodobacterales bacterium]
MIENRTFDEIAIGDSAELSRVLTARDIDLFAIVSGDVNPAHVDPDYAHESRFHDVIAHGMWSGSLISAVLGTELPGPGTIYVDQQLHFRRPVTLGARIKAKVTVTAKGDKGRVTLDCVCTNGDGGVVLEGMAVVIAPSKKIRRERRVMPEASLKRPGSQHETLLAKTQPLDRLETAVVHPCDGPSLEGAMRARELDLVEPILIGPEARIKAAAEKAEIDLGDVQIIDVPHSHAAARKGVDLVLEGKAEALMKGALHTDEIMGEVVDRRHGLRTERRMSHVFALDVPSYPKPLLVSDAAINIAPDLQTKADITQNAIRLAHALGVELPKVAILSAVETVYPKVPSTIEAAALCKMADRGQITGGLLDGPLAFDNAVSPAAVATKGIVSDVAGEADILIAPDLESGNMIAKQMIYLAGAQAAGIVLGARVPVMLTSRADTIQARVTSATLALLMQRYNMGIKV